MAKKARARALFVVATIGFCGLSLCLALGQGEHRDAVRTFHVSPKGDDGNPGTLDKPFATLARARDAVRANKKDKNGQPIQVLVSKGVNYLTSPLILTPEDSGTETTPITYLARPGEQVVLSGGRRITGWQQTAVAGKSLWTAELSDVRAGKWFFHQLWVNGQRRVRARHPNTGFLRIAGLPDVKKDTPWNQGQNRFQYHPGDIKAWANLADVEVVALHLWISAHLAIAQVDEKNHLVRLVHKSRHRLTDGAEPARYYLENALEFLDAPGEWYLKRDTGTLYYWPLPGEQLAESEVIAPILHCLMRFEGRPKGGQFVEHVRLRGLTFAHAEWWPAKDEPMDVQAAAPLPAVLQAEGMHRCVLENCSIAHAGGYGIHLGPGCQHNRIVGCEVSDLGAGGIKVGDMSMSDNPELQTHHNVVTDNHVFDLGKVFHQGVGIWIGQSFGNQIAHNHIHDLYYTGISCGWTWGYGKTLARDNVIEFNHVHDLGQGWLSDMGGIYTLGVQTGTVIRSNVFHDIAAYSYGGWGIYFDEGSTGIVAENNLVYRTTHGGFHQHYGKENVVRNNIFALGRDAQIRRTRQESHRSFTFERNIVYWDQGKLLDGSWDTTKVAFEKNLYWQARGQAIRFAGMTFEEWQGKGMDTMGVIADPLLAAPNRSDFKLDARSPATQIGFVPLDLSQLGPRR